jgi:hypothetical protein
MGRAACTGAQISKTSGRRNAISVVKIGFVFVIGFLLNISYLIDIKIFDSAFEAGF